MTDLLIRKHCLLWACVAWIFIQIPFATGPFRIDDPYHLKAAQQMLKAPGDPYGFYPNWSGTPEWAYYTYASPPLVPAWLALWSSFFPQNELSLHLAMLPFSLAALVTFGILARSFEVRPGIAMALLACSPAFFLTSQVLMPDMPMLCLFLLAVTAARCYQKGGGWPAWLIACVAGFCCPLAKYNGAVLIPVLLCLGLACPQKGVMGDSESCGRSSRLRTLLAGLTPGMLTIICAPILSLVCWGGFSWAKYGTAHFLAMSEFQRNPVHSTHPAILTAGVLGVVGLGIVPLGLAGFLSRLRKPSGWLAVLAALSAVCASWLALQVNYSRVSVFLFAISVSFSAYVLGLAVRQCWQSVATRDWNLMPLAVWILAGFAFQYGLMFAAVRYVLFLAPPMILLALRLSAWAPRESGLAGMLGANLLFTVALAVADSQQAGVYPAVVAGHIRSRLESGGRFFFDGHWGFQYYAEQIGGEPLDGLRPPVLRVGDLIAVAKTPWPKLLHPPHAPGLRVEASMLTVGSALYLRTVSCDAGASFYGSAISGCKRPTLLPFGFSWEPAETFTFYSIREPKTAEDP